MSTLIALLILGCGVFSIMGAAKQWDFFMNHRKAMLMQRIVGRTGTRIFYVTLGVALVGVGILFLVHGIPVDKAI